MRTAPSYPNPLLRGSRFDASVPQASRYYRLMRWLCQVTMCTMWKVRVFNRHLEPARGAAVYICNHQSFLDPMLMGLALRRPMNYMARDTLFRLWGFRQLIESVNAFPIRRGSADTAALKEAMRRLKQGGQVAVFPEGTRTSDGRIGDFLPGVALLSRRAADWTVPVVIDGAFEAWPRWQLLPGSGSVVVQYGQPISQAQARSGKPAEFVGEVRRRLIEMQADVRRRVGRPALSYE